MTRDVPPRPARDIRSRNRPQGGPYDRRDLWRAILLSAFTGWTLYAARTILVPALTDAVPLGQVIGPLVLLAMIGLPTALVACAVFGGPILTILMRRRIGWIGAAAWGGIIALVMCLASFAILEWPDRFDGGSTFSFGDGTAQIIEDNVRTAYGWSLLLRRWLWFTLTGIATALIVRAVIGPGRPVTN